jgi:imidazole glycerol-phosphate synthase subunit HisF
MLRPRIIVCLLIDNNRLVKTTNFKDPKYVGDPLNAVKIFNEKYVDELIVLDISASRENKNPNYSLIEKIAAECRMPLCYGGGIKSVSQAKKILSLGVEKISLSSAIFDNPRLLGDISKEVGAQSIVVTLDVKKKRLGSSYHIFTINGLHKQSLILEDILKTLQDNGVGEIVINSIDQDGKMNGYDYGLIEKVKQCVSVPLTVLGGAGCLDHFKKAYLKNGIIGMAAGSYFVFKGKFRAVLISYLSKKDQEAIFYKHREAIG